MDLRSRSVIELKALAYDESVKLEQVKQNLAVLNQVIQEKLHQAQQGPTPREATPEVVSGLEPPMTAVPEITTV